MTFLESYGQELSAERDEMVVIPEGCAHGVQILEPESELLYLTTASQSRSSEGGIRVDDPLVGIRWPLACSGTSPKDAAYAPLSADSPGMIV